MSMIDYLERHAEERPDAIAIKFEDRQISWGELNAKANQMAHYFQSRGVKYGDRVALNVENRPELLFAVSACLKLGAIAGMVNTGQTNEALAHSLRLIDPSLVVVGSECLGNMETVSDILEAQHADKLLYIADGGHAGPPQNYQDLMALVADQSVENPTTQTLTLGTPIYYIFTSGTTGHQRRASPPI